MILTVRGPATSKQASSRDVHVKISAIKG